MKKALQLIGNFLISRLFRNIAFWLIFFNLQFNNILDDKVYTMGTYLGLLLLCNALVGIFTYTNNLYLVPRYLAEKKYGQYILRLSGMVISFSIAFLLLLKNILLHFPRLHIYQICPITSPVSTSFSSKTIFVEACWWSIGWLIWLAPLTVAWFMNRYQQTQKEAVKALKHAEEMMEEIKKQQQLTELNFLKAQLNPHFLFNTLNNLYALSLKKSDHAPDAILRLSSILRYLLYESNVANMPFEKEKEIMEAYIDLELLRLTDKNNMSFTIATDKQCSIPPLLWLPILENVFKHGTRIISDQHFVEYRFIIESNKLQVYSKNNCKFLKLKTDDTSGGIGLTNLRKRLSLLYPDKHCIKTYTEDNQYIVDLNIDLA